MPPEIGKYIYDVQQAGELLSEFTQGKTLDDYLADKLLRSGVERQFMIVGEALMQAEKIEPNLKLSISALRQIIGFRNVLVHGYAIIKNQTVWGILQNELPLLRQEIDKMLGSLGSA